MVNVENADSDTNAEISPGLYHARQALSLSHEHHVLENIYMLWIIIPSGSEGPLHCQRMEYGVVKHLP